MKMCCANLDRSHFALLFFLPSLRFGFYWRTCSVWAKRISKIWLNTTRCSCRLKWEYETKGRYSSSFFITALNAAWRRSILLELQEDNKKMNVGNKSERTGIRVVGFVIAVAPNAQALKQCDFPPKKRNPCVIAFGQSYVLCIIICVPVNRLHISTNAWWMMSF